jgi:2-octaprenyl-3-methyl-6-methoxy-1,4-benzoquinol hydroxylase
MRPAAGNSCSTPIASPGVQVRCPAGVAGLEPCADGVRLRLEDGTALEPRLLLGADGAASTVRALAGIGSDAHDYGQRGVVCYVSSERPHGDTAWQRFLPGGPLALLPFADGDSSIVWTLPDAEAGRVLALDDAAFARDLTNASGGRLGTLRASSPRAAFPLRRLLAASHLRDRVLLLGDAAHVVHPLAGQGVNLGLRDVAALMDSVRDAQARHADPAAPQRLQRWARRQRSDNAVAAHAFGAINALFSNDRPAATLLRGPLLGLANRMPPLRRALWRHAAGD